MWGFRRMIAIKGMKMPKSCSDCDFCHGHICKRTGTDIITNPKGNCPLVEIINCKECKHWHVEREKIDKAIKIAKDSISACFELGLDERAFGMREILNIFEENIGK